MCEKPTTVNALQAGRLFALAKEHNTLLMEAVWTRFLPAIKQLQEALDNALIGEVLDVHANFSITGDFAPDHRLRNPDTAGGALLDLGIYPLSFADLIYQQAPCQITSQIVRDQTGLDAANTIIAIYPDNKTATLTSSYLRQAPNHAIISGSKGYIEVPDFFGPQHYVIHTANGRQTVSSPFAKGTDFMFEIDAFNRCLTQGMSESPILPHSVSLRLMTLMDTLRHSWGVIYPNHVEGI